MLSASEILQRVSRWFPGESGRQLYNVLVSIAALPQNFATAAPTVASVAGLITLTAPVTIVSGALAITGINVPPSLSFGTTPAGYGGRLTIIPTGAFTWTTATNIAVAGTAVVGKALDFTYDSVTNKWYPSYVA
jgi:hypothetical protein